MARDRAPDGSTTSADSLDRLLDRATQHLPLGGIDAGHRDGLLFTGNRHESAPRALFLDARLTPLERNAWQVFRMLLNDGGVTALPTYSQLRPFLTSMPCSGQASDETISRALTLLRLTRWLTLARHRRDPDTGRIQGNLYVLHDEPLCPYETIQLDPHYLELVGHSLSHASKAIQHVGRQALKEITEDPLLCGRVLPSRLHVLMQRLGEQEWVRQRPPSESEDGPKAAEKDSLRIPKEDSTSTVRTLINNKERTVPYANDSTPLRLPDRLDGLRAEQRHGVLTALQQVLPDLRQQVLDEWDARCGSSTIRNPAGYLFGLIQKALRGDFKAWAGPRIMSQTSIPPQSAPGRTPPLSAAARKRAEENLSKLRVLLHTRDTQ